MNIHEIAWQWITQNQVLALIIVLYVVASALPRPHPDKVLSPGWSYFWAVVDRMTIFTAERVPGTIKLIFARSPSDDEEPPAPPAPPSVGGATG